MNKILLTLLFISFGFTAKSQNATFITLDNAKNLYKVTVGAGGCTSTPLTFCNNFTGNPLSIALDGNILYVADNKGFLYKNALGANGTTGTCTNLGKFPTATGTYGLTVGNGGIVYAATGSKIETYTPSTSTFATLGTMNTSWTIGGDLLFYQGKLFEAVTVSPGGGNALIEVNLANVSASTLYMNFNSGTSVFGFASVTVPCSNNQAYALSTNTTTTDIFAVDMTNKTQSTTITCTLPYNVYDAASIAETQSATPPTNPTAATPYNFCQNQTATTITASTNNIKDTLRWYTQAVGGISYGKPTPAINTATPATTNYYVSNFDTSTGCESGRLQVVVNVIATPTNPTINITTPTTNLCAGTSTTFTANTTTGGAAPTYQWYINGIPVAGTSASTFTPTILNNNDTIRCTVTSNAACVLNPNATSNIIVIKVLTPTIVPLSFSSCSKVIYLGKTYTTSTTVKDTLKSVQGCDSVYHNVTITITPDISTTQTLNLAGCSSVVYKGITYTTNTSFKDTIRSVIGCGDSIYYNVNISIAPTLTAAPTASVTQQPTCNDRTGTIVFTSPIGANYYYSIDGVSYQNVTNFSGLAPATYFVTVKDSSTGCISASLKLVIDTPQAVPTPTGYVSVQPSCNNAFGTFIISSPHGNNYSYYINASGIPFTDTIFPGNTSGPYIITAIDDNTGCISPALTLTINPYNAITIKSDTVNLVDCKSITYKGITYTNNAVLRDTLTSKQGCDSVYNIVNIIVGKKKEYAYITTNDSIRVIDTKTNKIVASINVLSNALSITHNSKGDRVYVTDAKGNGNPDTMSVINTLINKVIATVPIGKNPYGVFLSPDETKVFAVNNMDSTISVVSTATNTLISTLHFPYHTYWGAITPNGKYLYVTQGLANTVSVYDLNLNTIVATIPVGNQADGIIINSKGTRAYVTNASSFDISVIDILNNTVITTINVTKSVDRGMCFSKDESLLYVSNFSDASITVINTSTNTIVSRILTGNNPAGININTLGNLLYVNCGGDNKIDVIDIATHNSVASIAVPNFPYSMGSFIVNVPDTVLINNVIFKNCDSIVYKNITYKISISFIDTIKTTNGCDSIYTNVNIVINKPTSSINSTTICKSQLPFSWNGLTFNKADTLTKNGLINSVGCDSSATLRLAVNPISSSITSKIICSNQLPFSWNGLTFNKADTLTKNGLINSVGCDSSATLQISIIKPIPNTKPPYIGCKPYVTSDSTYSVSTIIKEIVKSKQGCDSIYNFTTVTILSVSTIKPPINKSGCDSVNYLNKIYTTSTNYTDTFRNAQGCDSVYQTINITVYPKPTIVAGSDVYVMPSSSAFLNPLFTNTATVSWSPAKYLNDSTLPSPLCTPLTDQTYHISATSSDGCVDTSSLRVFVVKPINIPNVFSPNGDGINDGWVIENINTHIQNTVQVFNRYGQKIFESFPGNYQPWNGRYNGKDVPVGVYYYIISLSATTPVITGSITILR